MFRFFKMKVNVSTLHRGTTGPRADLSMAVLVIAANARQILIYLIEIKRQGLYGVSFYSRKISYIYLC